MIDLIKKFFAEADPDDSARPAAHDIRVATCALLLEMAEIDGAFSREQSGHIIDLLKREYSLSGEHAEEIAKAANEQRKGSIDLWRFTNLINENYSREEKLEVVELLWRLVYEDGHLSDHERYLMTKLRKMLNVTHRDLIDAKLKVLNESRDGAP